MSVQELLLNIHSLEDETRTFEEKYNLRSEIFFAAYMNGIEPENDEWNLDFSEWAGVYESLLELEGEYRTATRQATRDQTNVFGLVKVAA